MSKDSVVVRLYRCCAAMNVNKGFTKRFISTKKVIFWNYISNDNFNIIKITQVILSFGFSRFIFQREIHLFAIYYEGNAGAGEDQ